MYSRNSRTTFFLKKDKRKRKINKEKTRIMGMERIDFYAKDIQLKHISFQARIGRGTINGKFELLVFLQNDQIIENSRISQQHDTETPNIKRSTRSFHALKK